LKEEEKKKRTWMLVKGAKNPNILQLRLQLSKHFFLILWFVCSGSIYIIEQKRKVLVTPLILLVTPFSHNSINKMTKSTLIIIVLNWLLKL